MHSGTAAAAEASSFYPSSSSRQRAPGRASKRTQRSLGSGGSASLAVVAWVEESEAKSFQAASSKQVWPQPAFELAFGCLRDVTTDSLSCFG